MDEQKKMRIEAMYAFVAIDRNGDEGVCAYLDMGMRTWMPMVGADMARVESLRPHAQEVARLGGLEVRLLRFGTREEVEVIKPW